MRRACRRADGAERIATSVEVPSLGFRSCAGPGRVVVDASAAYAPTRGWINSGGSARVSKRPRATDGMLWAGALAPSLPLIRIPIRPPDYTYTGGTGGISSSVHFGCGGAPRPGIGARSLHCPRRHDPIPDAPRGGSGPGSAPRPALVRLPSARLAPAAGRRPARRVIGPRRQGEI